MTELKPFPYQQEGIDFLRAHERCLLADDQGTGKTMQALLALGDRGIVVAPPGLKYGWSDECKIWRPDLTPLVMEGMGMGRFKWPDAGQLVICGYNQLPDWLEPPPHSSGYKTTDKSKIAKAARKKLAAERKSFNKYMNSQAPYGATTPVIADEAHNIKNQKSIRARKFRMLSALTSHTWLLTGTPMPRGNPFDLLGVLRAAHLDQIIFPNYLKFKRLANVQEGYGPVSFGKPRKAFHTALKPFMLRRTKTDVAPWLPPKIHRTLTIALDERSASILDGLPSDLVSKIEHAQDASELTRLRTLPDFGSFSHARREIARARIPAMLEQVEIAEGNEQPLLVFSAHTEPVLALQDRDGWAVIHGGVKSEDRQKIIRDQHKYKGIAVTIKSGGAGLNLQKAFSAVLFVDLDWDVTQNAQAEDRVHRHGQESENVLYTVLTSNHPVDKLITEKLIDAQRNINVAIEGKR